MTIAYEVGDKLYLNITNRCPCACEFCIRNTGDGAYGSEPLWLEREPSVQEIIHAIEKTDLNKYVQVVFCGFGEPTERLDDMLEVCRYLRSVNSPEIRINTNGLSDLINQKDTAKKFEGMFDIVSISLNTCDAEKYDKLCHPKFGLESFGALLKFASDVKKYVSQVVLSIVDVIPADEIEECKQISQKLGIPLRIRKYDS